MSSVIVRDWVRDASGNGLPGVTVVMKRQSNGEPITTALTDSNGMFEMTREQVGYPGPYRLEYHNLEVIDLGSTNGGES